MSSVSNEKVLVVPTTKFHELGYFQGFTTDVGRYIPELLKPENVSFRPRHEVETDPGYKQLIPYMIFCHTDAMGKVHVFRYVRGQGMGEGRLHSKHSIGVGGHISQEDHADGKDVYQIGMIRELEEEVDLQSPYTEHCVGMINDDETEVGKVHLGVVHRFDLEKPALTSRETDLIESGFVPVETLLADLSRFETWSAITLERIQNWF